EPRESRAVESLPPPAWRRAEIIVRMAMDAEHERHDDMHGPAGLDDPVQFLEHRDGIVDVLERVEADHRVKAVVRKRQRFAGTYQMRRLDTGVDVDRLHRQTGGKKSEVACLPPSAHVEHASRDVQARKMLVLE